MKYALALIDKASEVCGGDAALSRRLEISRAAVSLMRSGERAVTPELAAEMADIAGEDARQAVIDTVIERNAANRKGKVLRDILGKALAAGVAGMLVFSYSGDSIFAMGNVAKTSDSLYIVFTRMVDRLRAWASAARAALACHAVPGLLYKPHAEKALIPAF